MNLKSKLIGNFSFLSGKLSQLCSSLSFKSKVLDSISYLIGVAVCTAQNCLPYLSVNYLYSSVLAALSAASRSLLSQKKATLFCSAILASSLCSAIKSLASQTSLWKSNFSSEVYASPLLTAAAEQVAASLFKLTP